MKKFLNIFIFLILFFVGQIGFSEQYKVIVIPDNVFTQTVDYVVYTDAAGLIATDVINYINSTDNFYAPTVGYVKKVLNSDTRTKIIAKQALKDFKTGYNIDFEAFKQLGRKFNTQYILLITSNIDNHNYMLRRTVWDFLNIPGATVVDPAYRISTETFLLDLKSSRIVCQYNYQKLLSSREGRIIANTFSPVPEQLEKIKNYSNGFLAPQIAQEVQTHIDTSIIIATRGKLIRPEVLTWDKGKAEVKKLGRKATEYSYQGTDIGLYKGQQNAIKAGKATARATRNAKKNIKQKWAEKREWMKEKRIQRQELNRQKKLLKETVKKNKVNPIEPAIQEESQNLPQNQNIENNVEIVPKNNLDELIEEKVQNTIQEIPFAPQKPRLRGETMINDI